MVLRAYQEKSIAELRAAYAAGSRAVLYVLPTGGGKTVVFSYIAAAGYTRGNRILLVAHRRELISQASDKLTHAGVAHGIIQADTIQTPDALVQVGSIQTLVRRLGGLPRFNLIIFDEAHHCVASTYAALIASQPQALILGVTATPERRDGRGLGRDAGGVFDAMVLGPPVADLIAQGFLAPARVFAPPKGPDLSRVRTQAGDFSVDQLSDVMGGPSVTGDAVQHYRRYAPGTAAIAFCVNVHHAEAVAEAFRQDGWRSCCVHGGMPTKERDEAIAGLATGDVQVLTSCDVVSEGLDVPALGAVILLRPTKSLGLALQQIGRGLRPALGKSHLIVLDHAGNTLRHGFVDTARQWSLESQPRPERETPTRFCPECECIHAMAPACPECGHGYPVMAPRLVQEKPGELIEVTNTEHLRTTPLRKLLTGNDNAAQLERIRAARGYKRGWAWHVLRSQKEAAAASG